MYSIFCTYLVPFEYVKWSRDETPIADSRNPQMTAHRVTLFNNGSLQIRDVRANDTAEYLCEVMTSTFILEKQLHAIEVQCKSIEWKTSFTITTELINRID